METIGTIDVKKFVEIASNIMTDEVILTEDRTDHIISRRGLAFFNEYSGRFGDILSSPDYIFRDKKNPNTAILAKTFASGNDHVNIVLRLAVADDGDGAKNSIITAIKENEKRFSQRVRNGVLLYKRLDAAE